MSKLILTALILCLCQSAFSQKNELNGKVRDTTSQENVKNAVVALLQPVDSVLIKFARTDANGAYKISDLDNGKYILMVMHPSFADYVEDIKLDGSLTLPNLPVTPKSKLLEAVILKRGSPIRIKGDTTI